MFNDDSVISASMSGKNDLAFGLNGVASINISGVETTPLAMINGPDDTLYVCGTARRHGESKFFITALNSTGEIVSEFGDKGYVIGAFDEGKLSLVFGLVLENNKLLLVAVFCSTQFRGHTRFHIRAGGLPHRK